MKENELEKNEELKNDSSLTENNSSNTEDNYEQFNSSIGFHIKLFIKKITLLYI